MNPIAASQNDTKHKSHTNWLDDLWSEVVARMSAPLPESTYRLQLNHRFTIRDATRIIPYLSRLGITHLYCSPYLKACSGSEHGYNIVDHSHLNPELGSDEDFEAFFAELATHGMRHILDFVPNHMGVSGGENIWWMDVLENGPSSSYADFFDIDWMPLKPDLVNKVLLPILGDQFGNVLEAGQLVLQYEEGSFWLNYYQHRLPIAPRSTQIILEHRMDDLEREMGAENPRFMEFQSILTAIRNLPPRSESTLERIEERRREKEVIKRRLNELTADSSEVNEFIHDNVTIFNGTPGNSRSYDLLDRLLQDQAYRLAFWRVATDEINYRRFFDINELAAISMENREVFEESHSLVFRLISEGKLHGLRIDHADGLYDPTEYLRELQRGRFRQLIRESARARSLLPRVEQDNESPGKEQLHSNASASRAELVNPSLWRALETSLLERFDRYIQQAPVPVSCLPLFVVVEKILEHGEELPPHWPVHGTSGYEFLAVLNGLLVNADNAVTFDRIYSRFVHDHIDFEEQVYEGKKLIVRASMSGEVTVLGHQLDRLSERDRRSRDFTLSSLTFAIREIIACFPVYRTYISGTDVLERDRRFITAAVARAKLRNPAFSASIFDFVRDTLLLKFPDTADERTCQAYRRFVGRFQQVTGPVMAKGVEDTAYYRFNRLVSLNEVGGSPHYFGSSIDDFHRMNWHRTGQFRHSLLATSTHDTKRSEDVRARINVLSEVPVKWKVAVARWSRMNKHYKTSVDGKPAPSRNDEYLLYQTLVGTWPLERPVDKALQEYRTRIEEYMIKAAREAKLFTSWISPSEPYEEALRKFLRELLTDSRKNHFLEDLHEFVQPVAEFGLWNSLSQTVLKLTAPGAPDTYQGTELWDFSLVDPDNRRPVDYEHRTKLLDELHASYSDQSKDRIRYLLDLLKTPRDGRVKLFVTSVLLNFRRDYAGLLSDGDYLPLAATGEFVKHLCAFARHRDGRTAIVVVPRLMVALTGETGGPPMGNNVWGFTNLVLPEDCQAESYRNLLTRESLQTREQSNIGQNGGRSLPIAQILQHFPVAILESTVSATV